MKGIVRKANSRKYQQLWPKAVLEALDEAIRENQWENALKVGGFFLFLFLFFLALTVIFSFLFVCSIYRVGRCS